MSPGCTIGHHCSLMQAMDGRIVRCGIISSCQSAATSKIVKRFQSLVFDYVSNYCILPLPSLSRFVSLYYHVKSCVCVFR